MGVLLFVAIVALIIYGLIKFARRTGEDQPVEGACFVTGCDSGMGETTAFHLAKTGYHGEMYKFIAALAFLKSVL